jgi:SAM-dependent MidA family methyltransferase
MTTKEKLIDFLKEKNIEIINSIETKLGDDEIQYAVDFIEKLNTISTHRITKIGHTEQGDFFVNCETGFTHFK